MADKTGLTRSDIVRLCLLRTLDVAESNPAALMGFLPEVIAMDGRRSELKVAESTDDNSEEIVQRTAKKSVDYRKVVKAGKARQRKPSK